MTLVIFLQDTATDSKDKTIATKIWLCHWFNLVSHDCRGALSIHCEIYDIRALKVHFCQKNSPLVLHLIRIKHQTDACLLWLMQNDMKIAKWPLSRTMHIRKVPHLILPERQETTQLISVASQLPISQIGRHSILVSWQFRFLFILTKVELTSSVQVKVLLQLQRYRQPTIPGTHQPTHIDTKTTSALTPFVTVAPSDELGSLRNRNYHHVNQTRQLGKDWNHHVLHLD